MPAVHDHDPVGHGHGLFLVVRDVDECDPDLVLDPLQLKLHLLAQLEVERTERLVEEEHPRPVHERASERDPLLLAAGELPRFAPFEPGEADELERLDDPPVAGRRSSRRGAGARRRRSRRSRDAGRARTTGRRCSRRACTAAAARRRRRRARSAPRSAPRSRRSCAASSSCRSPTARAARRSGHGRCRARWRRRRRRRRTASSARSAGCRTRPASRPRWFGRFDGQPSCSHASARTSPRIPVISSNSA